MTRGGLVVAEARKWIGTPYRHQGSLVGAGTDCLGLLRGIWRSLCGDEPESIPAYTHDWSETTGQEDLLNAARRWLVPKAMHDAAAGDALLFRMRPGSVAKHLGVLAETGSRPTFVHAYTAHGVIETPLSAPWARRVVARFEFPLGE